MPQISLTVNNYIANTNKIYINSIQSNVAATIYFILVSYKNITTNKITSQTSISIRTLIQPTSNQIASCVDGSGYAAAQCMRVSAQGGKIYSLTLPTIV